MGYNNEASWDSRLESVENELRERESAYDPDLSRAISCLNEARMMIFRWRRPGWFEQYHFERSSSEASADEADASEDACGDFFICDIEDAPYIPCDCPICAPEAGLDEDVAYVMGAEIILEPVAWTKEGRDRWLYETWFGGIK